MGIQVHRNAESRMAKSLHYHTRMNILREQQARACMPKVMKPLAPQPSLIQELAKAPPNVTVA